MYLKHAFHEHYIEGQIVTESGAIEVSIEVHNYPLTIAMDGIRVLYRILFSITQI